MLVIRNSSSTRLGSAASFRRPPRLRALVKPETSSPSPELSIAETPLRLSTIFGLSTAETWSSVSRNAPDPLARVILPAALTTVTSPSLRVVIERWDGVPSL